MSASIEKRLIDKYKNSRDPVEKRRALLELAAIREDELKGRMTPIGGIPGLHPVLDERRFIYAIPDGAFKIQASFNVCFVWQIGRFTGGKYGDTMIEMPDTAKQRVDEETPRGILLSAGLAALDCLRSNGIEIGHVVSLLRLAPFRMPCDMINGVEKHILILRAGDITGSEDLDEALRLGKCKVVYDDETAQHHYVDAEGKRWNPKLPFIGADY